MYIVLILLNTVYASGKTIQSTLHFLWEIKRFLEKLSLTFVCYKSKFLSWIFHNEPQYCETDTSSITIQPIIALKSDRRDTHD